MNSILAMNIRIEMTQMNDKNSKQVVSSKLKKLSVIIWPDYIQD